MPVTSRVLGGPLRSRRSLSRSGKRSLESLLPASHPQIQQQAKEKKTEGKRPRSFFETEKGQKLIKEGRVQPKAPPKKKDKEEDSEEDSSESEEEKIETVETAETTHVAELTPQPSASAEATPVVEESQASIEENKKLFLAKMAAARNKKPGKDAAKDAPKSEEKKGSGKKMQTWGKGNKTEQAQLNFSSSTPDEASASSGHHAVALGAKERIDLYATTSGKSVAEDEEAPKSGGFMSFFSSFTNSELTESTLVPVMERFRSHLISKNVAQDIADQLCNSVKAGLLGKTHSTFTRSSIPPFLSSPLQVFPRQ